MKDIQSKINTQKCKKYRQYITMDTTNTTLERAAVKTSGSEKNVLKIIQKECAPEKAKKGQTPESGCYLV